MASITSAGLGSGIDVTGIVEQLVAAERAPTENRLNRQEAVAQAELSSFGTLKGALASLQSLAGTLSSPSNFKVNTANSSDTTKVAISATSTAAAGSYNVETTSLAQTHSLASKAFTSTADPVGEGVLTFRFGTYASGPNTFTVNADKAVATVTIDSTNNSLQGIRDAINDADIGVRASIVNDGSGSRLTFISEDSGVKNSIEVTVSGDSIGTDIDDTGLSQLAYDPTAAGVGTGKNLSETQEAKDAVFTVNGLSINSATNTVSDAIEGVTLTLKGATDVGTPVSLTVAQNKNSVTGSVNSFVSAYNELIGSIDSVSGVDLEAETVHILTGDSTVRTIAQKIRDIVGLSVNGLTGSITSLSNIGITTNADNELVLDSSKLAAALDNDFDVVSRLFSALGEPSDSLINYSTSTEDTKVGDYAVSITTLATQGKYTGAVAALTVDATNDTFVIKADGISSATITLTQGVYASGAALAAELQSRINGDTALKADDVSVVVSYVTDHFEITSSRYGSASKVELTTVEGSGLGLSVGSGTDGVDVAGSINGLTATGSGQFLTGVGDAAGLKLEIIGGITGDRGTINFTRGVSDQLNTLIGGYLEDDGLLDSRTDGLKSDIEDIGEQRIALDRRMESVEARLLKQFIAMDILVSQLQMTSTFLTQQLSNLPGAFRFKSD